jgi:hypothetical protein
MEPPLLDSLPEYIKRKRSIPEKKQKNIVQKDDVHT